MGHARGHASSVNYMAYGVGILAHCHYNGVS